MGASNRYFQKVFMKTIPFTISEIKGGVVFSAAVNELSPDEHEEINPLPATAQGEIKANTENPVEK